MRRSQMRTVLVDPHLHTDASYDAEMTPEELLQTARGVGLDGVVVTDHDTVDGARVVADLAPEYDLVAIVGCEVSTADGHLLALGVDSAPEPGHSLGVTASVIRDDGGVAVVPHPFQRSRHGVRRSVISDVDGIEVYNALTVLNVRNQQAATFAERHQYPAYGGSDAHRPTNIGRAVTEVQIPAQASLTPRTILESMRSGRTAAAGRRTSTWQYLTKFVGNARYKRPSFI